VLFLDGDGSDPPGAHPRRGRDPSRPARRTFVLGSRLRGAREPGSLSLPQVAAGRVAGVLLRASYGVRFTDMSPFRAIRRDALDRLGMRDETYGWNLEMLMRVAAAGLRAREVPVGQRRRAGGVSKVSGNLRASAAASWTIAATFLRLAAELRRDARVRRA
jgi:hypothetical protein